MGIFDWFKGFLSGKNLRTVDGCDYELKVDYL